MSNADLLDDIAAADQLRDRGELQEALSIYRKVISKAPDMALGYFKLGTGLARLHALRDAEAAYREAIALREDYSEAYNNLGILLFDRRAIEDAEHQYRRALAYKADYLEATINLGTLLFDSSRSTEAVSLLEACSANPARTFAEQLRLAGILFHRHHEFDGAKLLALALERPVKARALLPDERARAARLFAETGCFDGMRVLGDIFECVEPLPDIELKGYLLRLLTYTWTPTENTRLRTLYKRHNDALERMVLESGGPFDSLDRLSSPEVIVGFLGSLFESNSTAKFFLPVLPHLRDRGFRLIYYSSIEYYPDDRVQQRALALVDDVRWVHELTPGEVARQVYDDKCTILIDLDGFSRWSKTEAFVFRPAPIQISWINWPSTLGLDSADYFLGSEAMIPLDPNLMAEVPISMCTPYGSFTPLFLADIEPDPPCITSGRISFGNTSHPYKLSSRLIHLWSKVLERVPGSMFRLLRHECAHDTFCEMVAREFLRWGITPNRLEFVALTPGSNHLEAYSSLDIALDSAPYSGATTAADCLWMGVPLITLIGPGLHQRLSYSVLVAVGVDELACDSESQYVDCAVRLAADTERIAEYRTTLRTRFRASPLCDPKPVADEVVRALHFALDDMRHRVGATQDNVVGDVQAADDAI